MLHRATFIATGLVVTVKKQRGWLVPKHACAKRRCCKDGVTLRNNWKICWSVTRMGTDFYFWQRLRQQKYCEEFLWEGLSHWTIFRSTCVVTNGETRCSKAWPELTVYHFALRDFSSTIPVFSSHQRHLIVLIVLVKSSVRANSLWRRADALITSSNFNTNENWYALKEFGVSITLK